ncbi:YbaB/EbfC family nucleoid-associated protein [Amycolatopsis sp. NPDC059021]|uniref:YbaB/EbfC family nucleoid-associated protein n=1 Tax=Amycolatopsis sp. NPDC059021 TaxID=3346704 RepID=UPI0036730A05
MSNPELVEEMRWQLRRITEQRAKNDQLLTELARTTSRVSSPDGSVTVATGPDGEVLEVKLTPEAMKQDADALGHLITTVLRGARTAPKPAEPAEEIAPEHEEPYENTIFDA